MHVRRNTVGTAAFLQTTYKREQMYSNTFQICIFRFHISH